MPEYQCERCTARIEAKDLDEAIARIDHATGLSKGRPCRGGGDAPVHEMKQAATVQVTAELAAEPKKETKKPKSDEQSE